jgi:hypothetical protein
LPQYFVMIGGGVDNHGASFGKLAAKIPARRIPEAVERLVDFYDREKAKDEAAFAFFQRVTLESVKALLADLERLTAAEALDTDFIDLGEQQAFAPEVMEGECAT